MVYLYSTEKILTELTVIEFIFNYVIIYLYIYQ